MNDPLQFKVFDRQQVVYEGEFNGPVQLGRQKPLDDPGGQDVEEVFRPRRLDANRWRLAIAPFGENEVSRMHALVEPLGDRQIRISNLSTKVQIRIQSPSEMALPRWSLDQSETPPSQVIRIPCIFHLGNKTIRIQESEPDPGDLILQSLSEVSRPPGRYRASSVEHLRRLREPDSAVLAEGPDPEVLVRWLQSTIGVLQDAANANDFFQRAAEAMVENVGLETGWVLTWEDAEGDWCEQACHCTTSDGKPDRRPSRKFLNNVRSLKKTSWRVPDPNNADSNRSLADVQAAVAAPILDRNGNVIGALYGDRVQGVSGPPRFSKLEALMVDLLAGGVATGLARLQQENLVERVRGQFEQFFGRDLAEELRQHPDLMEGREAEITVLFADIRNFSGVSRILGHKATFEWINYVMETLSDCVTRHQGVLVDYLGDALMAMWGAPKHTPDHAIRACQAALDMLATVPEINQAWNQLPENMGLGVGINTGMAQIGNTGSSHRFKYGPLGNTVNLASRLEGATKYLKAGLIVSESTQRLLGETFSTRKLCSVRVVNIDDPVSLHEVTDPERFEGDWHDLRARYGAALAEFEDQEFRKAARTLGNLLTDYPIDGPSLVLMKRAVNGLIEGADPGHPVWDLPGK